MKTPQLALLIALLCYSQNIFSQQKKVLAPGHYVVVGAFSPDKEHLAINYSKHLSDNGLQSDYGFNSVRNYWYVYVKHSDDLKSALELMREKRKDKQFADTWVWTAGETVIVKEPETVEEPAQSQITAVQQNAIDTSTEKSVKVNPDIIVTDNEQIKQFPVMTLENTEVFLSLYNARNNKVVEGTVKVVDSERNKLIKEVPGNDYMTLPDPRTTSGKLSLICEAFGYRKVQQDISYPLPLADTAKGFIELMGTTFIIYFDLLRYEAGDIATLYHVYFFNDAAVMQPESKFELTSLLEMLNENPNYRIRLHGHSNGKQGGKIIRMGEDRNYFSLTGSVNGSGSAKELSRARAEVIKDYMVDNGIAADRIEILAWGGKKPIYERNSANARKNVRVEVEILAD